MQVLANLAIVLTIPAGGREEGKEDVTAVMAPRTPDGLCGTEKPSAFTNAARAAAQTL